MPIFFLVVGVMLIVVGINDKLTGTGSLSELLSADFQSSNNIASFQTWMAAIFGIGAIGYYRPAKPVANALLALIIIVMLLSNKGLFQQFAKEVGGNG